MYNQLFGPFSCLAHRWVVLRHLVDVVYSRHILVVLKYAFGLHDGLVILLLA